MFYVNRWVQVTGCHNINLVTPTHVVPQVLSALVHAVKKGLRLPVIYNYYMSFHADERVCVVQTHMLFVDYPAP